MNKSLIETKMGLPNTCWNCAQDPGETWFAEHEDGARSGRGICHNCAKAAERERGTQTSSDPAQQDGPVQPDQGSEAATQQVEQPESGKGEAEAKPKKG